MMALVPSSGKMRLPILFFMTLLFACCCWHGVSSKNVQIDQVNIE